MRQEGEQIIMTTPFGDVPVKWLTNRALGTIDIGFPDVVSPTRLSQVGDSLIYTFTFSVPAELPEAEFRKGQHGMDEELQTLKRILEA